MNNHDVLRREAVRAELAERIGNAISDDGVVEPIPGLYLNRASQPIRRVHGVTLPALCVIAQGTKEVYLGESRYRYDPEHYLLATVELPVTAVAIEASNECPYLSLRLDLDPALVSSVMVEASIPVPRNQSDAKAVVVSALDFDLLDAALRLGRALYKPAGERT